VWEKAGAAKLSVYPKLESPKSEHFRYPDLESPAKRPHLRSSVHIPFDLPEVFQSVAAGNTRRGIETCGILLGPSPGRVTHCLVPPQTGTADTCETLPGAEEGLLAFSIETSLISLGWIHTHPTQSCFLSSVDMHTAISHQIMLPEAISVVIAPTDENLPVGVWRLTERGMAEIGKCRESGFHDHDNKEKFSEMVPNVDWDTTVRISLIDNR
jgi:STAM-binding protein